MLSQRAASAGMSGHGMVETVSCLDGEGRPVPDDLRWGDYVVFKAASDYVAGCSGLRPRDRPERPVRDASGGPAT
ncbi:MAG: hypothetical protein R3D25_02365 [Geminicoccaceae bacterium]